MPKEYATNLAGIVLFALDQWVYHESMSRAVPSARDYHRGCAQASRVVVLRAIGEHGIEDWKEAQRLITEKFGLNVRQDDYAAIIAKD
jgi:hypothetical protein